jgi:adenylylsulfate kinase
VLERLENAGKSVRWLNADDVRKKYNDWDFSVEGRIRQSKRMHSLATLMDTDYVICDFICPLPIMRDNFDADYTVWVDTITEGRFNDTNKLFVPPDKYDFRITEQDSPKYSELIAVNIINGK